MIKFDLAKRKIDDYFSTLGPKLIIVADKPLQHDCLEIFDSPRGMEYLSKCFESKFKSAETHVTYIKDTIDEDFCRKGIYSILHHYIEKGTLDLNNLFVAFVGNSSFDSMMRDYMTHMDKERIHSYINRDKKLLKLFDNDISRDNIFIPYIILPEVDDVFNYDSIPEKLNSMINNGKTIASPYCTSPELISKLDEITRLYEAGEIDYFRFDIKMRPVGDKIEYLKVYDKYTNTELLYCPGDEILKDEDPALAQQLKIKLKESLISIPVYNSDDTLQDKIKCMGFWQQVNVLKYEQIDEKPTDKESFVLTGNFDGNNSEWYDKWYKEAFTAKIKNTLTKRKINDLGYNYNHRSEWIYDIEVFKEDWLFVAKTLDGKNKLICWNSPDKLREWIQNKILIGFNNAQYDDDVIRYAMVLPYLKSGAISVKQYSDQLINGEKPKIVDLADKANAFVNKDIRKFLSWDISFHLPFDVTRNSLKKLTMSVLNRRNYDSNVPFDIDRSLTLAERKEVEKYCEMDVDNTMALFLKDPENEKREYASQSYDIRWNMIVEYGMTARTLINRAASFAGKLLCGEDAKANLQNKKKFDPIVGEEVYYSIPELAYKELAGEPILDFYIKNQKNPDYIKEKIEIYLGGNDASHLYQFGFGGLHQALINYGSQNLVNMDVASLYPSLLIQYKLMSRGAAANPDSYEQVYNTRIEAKHTGKKLLNLGLKLVLNSAIGAMLTEFNPLYDTWSNSSVCVHGQLLLFILVKRLYNAGFNIVQTNTDGIMIERQENVDFMPIAEKWMEETRLVLEFDEIKILQQNNVNNYYCEFTNGKIKSKGFYQSNEKFGKATSKILCNIVTEKPLFEGTEPRDFVIFKRHGISEICDAKDKKKLEGRSLAFVVGHPDDPRTREYISISKNEKQQAVKDEKGKTMKDENGNPIMETIRTESKITGFTKHMLIIDDMNTIKDEDIDKQEYVNFARNLLSRTEEFGPYYNEFFNKVEEPAYLQALNQLKDNTDKHPTKAGVTCQNFLFECDYMTKEEQEAMIKHLEKYTYRIVWSGHRSYHIVVRIDRPVTSLQYKKLWYLLQYKLGIENADEQANLPNKYTRVPDQINPKTGEMQTLYSYGKYVFDTDVLLDELPKNIKDIAPEVKEYKGDITIEALQKHIKRLHWGEGERFASCQKLSPVLISQVEMEELIKMIPCKLEKDHKAVIRSKYWYFKKHKEELLNESGDE